MSASHIYFSIFHNFLYLSIRMKLVYQVFENMQENFQSPTFEIICIFSSLIGPIKTQHGIAVELNEQGEVLRVLQDPEGKLTYALSQLTELSDGRMALGSYFTSMSIGDAI